MNLACHSCWNNVSSYSLHDRMVVVDSRGFDDGGWLQAWHTLKLEQLLSETS